MATLDQASSPFVMQSGYNCTLASLCNTLTRNLVYCLNITQSNGLILPCATLGLIPIQVCQLCLYELLLSADVSSRSSAPMHSVACSEKLPQTFQWTADMSSLEASCVLLRKRSLQLHHPSVHWKRRPLWALSCRSWS